jgi:GNAT superfamily N-acetyltransferase
MSNFRVKELKKMDIPVKIVQKFLFRMIQNEYNYGYIPQYHQDIKNIDDYYLNPERNNFYVALHNETNQILGTIGVRSYDKNFPLFKGIYYPEITASIWRVFVDKPWRRNGVASTLVGMAEEFCQNKGYKNIYLHTHKTVNGSLDFWLSKNYSVVEDTENELRTVHMEKSLIV